MQWVSITCLHLVLSVVCGRLAGKSRPEICLLYDPNSLLPHTHVHLPGGSVPDQLPPLISPLVLYQDPEASNCSGERTRGEVHCLHGRHPSPG